MASELRSSAATHYAHAVGLFRALAAAAETEPAWHVIYLAEAHMRKSSTHVHVHGD